MYLQIAALLLLTTTTPAQNDDQDIKPRTFGPLLGSIGSVLLGGLAGHWAEEEFGPLAPYYGPSYGPYLLVNRPHYGHIDPYGLNGYGYPALAYPFFRNARLQYWDRPSFPGHEYNQRDQQVVSDL
jgi:hypothetical protein